MQGWEKLPLGRAGVVLLDCDHKTPEAVLNGRPYIGIPQMTSGRIDFSTGRQISEADFVTWTRKTKYQHNDVVLSRRTNPGVTAIDDTRTEFALGQNLVLLRANGKRVEPAFLRWLIRTPEWWEQIAKYINVGAVFSSLRCRDVPHFELTIPPLPEQRAIAATLGALDDKIELNRRMNETLEAMARALFRDWFVDFGPIRAKMAGTTPYLSDDIWSLFPDRLDPEGKPEGWKYRSVYAFANVVYGAPFASKMFNSESKGHPLIRIRDLADHAPGIFTEELHTKGHLIAPGDIVVGMDGEFRLHVWKGQPAWLNQRVCHFEPLEGIPLAFLVEALKKPLEFFERGKVGTTVIHLGKGDIDTFQLLHPGDQVLLAFSMATSSLIEATVRNELESRTLAQTRDLLLPCLMSGALRIAEAERMLEEVA